MTIQTTVGASAAKLPDSSTVACRAGNQGEVIVSELHGRYYEQAYRGKLFNASNTAGVTTSVALATTYVGLCLSNPIGSGVNLELIKAGWAFLLAWPAASVIGLMQGFSGVTNVTHSTPMTPRNALYNGLSYTGLALVDSNAILPVAPVLMDVLGQGLTGAITVGTGGVMQQKDYEGSVLVPPGGYVAFYTSTASGASAFLGSFVWAENPI